ncbi:MAG: TlpA disulfide reductase family protein [Pseudomonadota bacterium]
MPLIVALAFCLTLSSAFDRKVVRAAVSHEALKTHGFTLYEKPHPSNEMLLKDVNGKDIKLTALRGQVVILNFWRIDCPPCSLEKPILEATYRKYRDRGLIIVAVNLFDDGKRVANYLNNNGLGFVIALDSEKRLSVRKQSLRGGGTTSFVLNPKNEAIYEIKGVPTSYLINRSGDVVGHSVGMTTWDSPPLNTLLESLLSEHGRDSHIASSGTRVKGLDSRESTAPGSWGFDRPAGQARMPSSEQAGRKTAEGGSSGASSPPPLPPARPYAAPSLGGGDRSQTQAGVPWGIRSQPRNNAAPKVVPDQDGYVMATIPGPAKAPKPTTRQNRSVPAASSAPAAMGYGTADPGTEAGPRKLEVSRPVHPFGRFILEAFEEPSATARREPSRVEAKPRPTRAGEGSLWQRVGDIGSEILNAIIPKGPDKGESRP